jgi:hypothetical protein
MDLANPLLWLIGGGQYLYTLIFWAFLLLHTRWHPQVFPALFMLLVATALNAWIKPWFHVPLAPHLTGFAFPSGHTFIVTTFFGTLAWQARSRPLQLAAIVITLIYGTALVAAHYHTPDDVLAGYGCALLLIAAWSWIHLTLPPRLTLSLPWLMALSLWLNPPPGPMPYLIAILLSLGIAWPLMQHLMHRHGPPPSVSLLLGLGMGAVVSVGHLVSPTLVFGLGLWWMLGAPCLGYLCKRTLSSQR